MLNCITLIGRLGRQPELRTFESGTQAAFFSLATHDTYRDRDGQIIQQTQWHDVTVWGARSARLAETLDKGTLVFVEGKVTHRRYTDRDGVARYKTEIIAETVRRIDRRKHSAAQEQVVQEPVVAEV